MSIAPNPTDPRHPAPDIHRVMPHNLEAEQGVLGSMLISPTDVIPEMLECISRADFYWPAHRTILDVILAMWSDGRPADVITLTAALRDRNRLDEVGGPAFITHLFTFTPTAASAGYYAELVREDAIRRQHILDADRRQELAYSRSATVEELDECAHVLAADRSKAASSGTNAVSMRELAMQAVDRLQERFENRGVKRGIGTGFPGLDRKTGRWQTGQMIVVAAPEKQGKSSLARQFAEFAAVEERQPVAYFSHEMSQGEIVDAMIASRARVDSRRVEDGTLGELDLSKITHAAAKLAEAPIFVFDEAGCSLAQYRANLRRAVQEYGVKLAIVDYLQLINGTGKEGNRENEVAAVSRETKLLAKELGIPIIILCQLNEGGKTRESRAIQMDLDKLIVIEHEDPEAEGDGKAWLNVKLNRGGPKGKTAVMWRPSFTRFDVLSLEKDA